MKTFKEFHLQEALQGDGDCYETAGRIILNMHSLSKKLDLSNAKVVHALVHGQGELEGVRFGHGWIELNGTVYDYSNGNDIEFPARAYHAIGHVEKKKGFYAEYDQVEFREKILDSGHWGPWDIDHSKEGDILRESSNRDQIILPKENKKIGKKRQRISKNILKLL